MRLGRCEEDLYQQQQQSARVPNRMSLHEKGITVVRKEGI